MGNIFAGSEIVEIGIQIEKNGKEFYGALAAKSRSRKIKDIFSYLAEEEEKHMQVFQKILGSVERYEPAEAYPGEYFAYMNALAGESVFTQKDKGRKLAEKIKGTARAVEIGITAEKDSIVFYEGMKKAVPQYSHKIIDEVIAQEQTHLRRLMDLKASL